MDCVVGDFYVHLDDPSLESGYFIIGALDECETDLPRLLQLVLRSTTSSGVKWILARHPLPLSHTVWFDLFQLIKPVIQSFLVMWIRSHFT
jgi:hypothetical protein